MIKRAYEWLFCAFYQWSVRVNGNDSFHVLYASLMLGFVLLLNISVVLLVFDSVTEFAAMDFIIAAPTWLVFAGSVAYFVLHYSYFGVGRRYQHLMDEYRREAKQLGPRRAKIVAAYVAGSFLLLVALLFLLPLPK
jgi:hypothetical protein